MWRWILLASLMVSTKLPAQHWFQVTGTAHVALSIDTVRVRKASDTTLLVWVKLVFDTPRVIERYQKPVAWNLSLERLDCRNSMHTGQHLTLYAADGDVVDTINDPSSPEAVPPGTLMDGVLQYACTKFLHITPP